MALPLSDEMKAALAARGEEILAILHNESPSRLALSKSDLQALRSVLHPETWDVWCRTAGLDRDHPDTADAIARCGCTVIVPTT